MGENILGFGVGVGCDTTSIAGSVCVGALTDGAAVAGVAVLPPVQAVSKIQATKVRINTCFIRIKYIEQKLSRDEYYEDQPCEGLLR